MNSKYTAIRRNVISAPMKILTPFLRGRILDYGCGRGFDHNLLKIYGYDPLWGFPLPDGKFDTITCNYVLNVVSKDTQREIIVHIFKLLNEGGTAFFTVRRDIKTNYFSKWCEQRVVNLPFESFYHKKGQFEIYKALN